MKLPKKVGWLAGIFLIGVVLAGLRTYRITPPRISPDKYQQIFEEITSLEVSINFLTPDRSGGNLAYVHSTEQGRGLAILDLKSLARKEIAVTNEVTQMGGWSPDDRYLAFVQNPPVSSNYHVGDLKESWLTLWDRESNAIRRLTDATEVAETYFFWVSTNSYIFVTKKTANRNGASEIYMGSLGENTFKKVSNYMPELTVMNEKLAGYAYKGNIFELEIKPLQTSEKWGWDEKTRTVRQLTQFGTNDFDQIKWLRYNSATSNFLFCARPTNSTWRYLFELDPQSNKLTQKSQEDTYNGQYIDHGGGFAYVGNLNNSFYLAVRPQEPTRRTNLLQQGSVVSYAASPDGERIYVHGAMGDEPQGIWEYSLTNQCLRQVASGMAKQFVASRVISPNEIRIKSLDEVDIPCFFFTPSIVTDVAKTNRSGLLDKFLPRTKYPAVIYIPPNSAQMQRSFGPRSQFLANIGFYFLAVNYRGVDGYGSDYVSMGNTEDAAQDILAAYRHLVKNPNVDKENIFIFSMSGGTPICLELLAVAPELWRGMAIDKPMDCPIDSRFAPEKLPPLLFITGDQDEASTSLKAFATWAKSNNVALDTRVYKNAGHITFDLSSRKQSQKEVAEFFLDHLR